MSKRKSIFEKGSALDNLLHVLPGCLIIMITAVGLLFGAAVESGLIDLSRVQDILGFTVLNEPTGSAEIPDSARKFCVYAIDVGQGDSFLIYADGKSILIDAGTSESAGVIGSVIRSKGIQRLDYIIATHPHADHIGAMADIINEWGADKIIVPRLPDSMVPTTRTYEDFLLSVKNNGLKLTAAKAGTVYSICEPNGIPVTMTVLAPAENALYGDLNDYSVCVRIDYGKISWLFAGDLSEEGEADLIKSGADIDVTAYKVSHHGSNHSSTKEFLERVTPAMCVISCGEGNSYGHPGDETMDRLRGYTEKIYRTDLDSTIAFYSDGEKIYAAVAGKEDKNADN